MELDCGPIQSFHEFDFNNICWCNVALSHSQPVLEVVDVSIDSLYSCLVCYVVYGITVRVSINFILPSLTLRSGLSITCRPDEFSVFNPPSGQTCQQWAGDFVNSFGGYLNNPNATSSCEYCQYSVGDQYFTPLNIRYENRWRDVWILFCFFSM